MPIKFIVRTALMAAAVWAVFSIVSGLRWDNEWLTLIVIALIIGVVNAVIRPIARLLTLPIRIMTLGLFSLVINILLMAGVLWAADELELGVTADGWESILLGGILLAVAGSIVSLIDD
jgi:putative membrane protein